jgi:hypothetical protein
MTIQHTTEFAATSPEVIQAIAAELAASGRKFLVFKSIYSGGSKPKTATVIAARTGFSEGTVLQLATPMANKQYFEPVKYDDRKAFKKYPHINAVKSRIMTLAKNPRKLDEHVSTRTPKQTVSVEFNSRKRKEISVKEIFIDDVVEFKRVKRIAAGQLPSMAPNRLPEKLFKYGVASIIGEKGKFQDWGGEKNDLYTSHVTIGNRRRSTAFAFKGPATKPPLTPAKLGKNADQIQRLFSTVADAFFVQFEGRIEDAVKAQMLAEAIKKSHETGRQVLYGLIALEDSHRLRAKYASHFTERSIPLSDK